MIKDRIPLEIVEGKLVMNSMIECRSLRVRHRFMRFVIDTGSSDSYLSDLDVKRLQIPIKDRRPIGDVNFGGSTFKQVPLPKFKIYLLMEDNDKNDYLTFDVPLTALKTTKMAEKKRKVTETLPSILGMDFLREQKLSLHVILTEDLAYLQYEG